MVGKDFVTLTERAYYNITATIEDFILFTRSYVKLDAEWLQILRLKCKNKKYHIVGSVPISNRKFVERSIQNRHL